MYLCGSMRQYFLPFLRLNNDLLYIYLTFSSSIYLSLGLWVAFTSWLLWLALLWTWVCRHGGWTLQVQWRSFSHFNVCSTPPPPSPPGGTFLKCRFRLRNLGWDPGGCICLCSNNCHALSSKAVDSPLWLQPWVWSLSLTFTSFEHLVTFLHLLNLFPLHSKEWIGSPSSVCCGDEKFSYIRITP